DYKMQLATQLLRDTNQSITEIAEQCGYDYASHFCTAFKRRFGVSPNEERKKFK
ncbi:MAG: AraC family transcriptional regulator, partial [Bacteroidia bacterium]